MKRISQSICISDSNYNDMLDSLAPDEEKNTTVELDGGKYKAVVKHDGGITVYRHGEEWRNCTGDNLIYWLIVELAEARK